MDKKVQRITDSMEQKFHKLKEDIKRENRELIDTFEGRIYDLEKENENLREHVGNLENACLELQDSQKRMCERFNDLEQHGRKNSIRIFGLKDTSEKETVEECKEKVVKLVNTKLNVGLRGEDIDVTHRLGKFVNGKNRNVIVKFTHRTKKHEIMKEKRMLKGSGITIFEDLTKFNQDRLKEAYRLNSVKNSYSIDGKLFVILKDGRKRRLSYDMPLNDEFLMKDEHFRRTKYDA
ncbi:uncharacterized protein LOC117316976 [Pecten maximus]|uniref:uncharacterized protein LOC117316976 n=1 Tax=Pecten maximus TaxID=6579 RepID=UPI0014590A7B|nr:uncharacterized protein LOC117316976 [Pecten maximus]